MTMNANTRPESPPQPVPFAPGWHAAWCAVFVANLPVPLILGYSSTARAEFRAGIIAALVTALVLGHVAIAALRMVRGVLVCGGLCIALSQVLFLPHMVVGLLAFHVVGTVLQPAGDFGNGFWLTLVTGGVLMLGALVLGSPCYGLGTRTEAGSGRP
jgi:hypothetical protein